MPEDKEISLPFLTRKMLDFEHGTKFQLGVNIWAFSGETVIISGLSKDSTFTFKIKAPTNGTRANHLLNITDIPIKLSVYSTTGNIDRGKIYIDVYLALNGTKVYSFIAGYVETTVGLTWPYGRSEDPKSGMGVFESVATSNPAAGDQFDEYVPTGKYWNIKSFTFDFTTDATVADRVVRLRVLDPYSLVYMVPSSVVQPASTTKSYQFGVGLQNLSEANTGIITIPIPPDLWLTPGANITTWTKNMQAADNFAAGNFWLERLMPATY